MIAHLRGKILEFMGDELILDIAGIGYIVKPVDILATPGMHLSCYIYDHIREDRRELYAFSSLETRQLFLHMIAISGIGPKIARSMLSGSAAPRLKAALQEEDLGYLVSLPGIGKKTAQKILLELRGVLAHDEHGTILHDKETLEALMSLGYARDDVLHICEALEGETASDRLKFALQRLGSNV
ncbi:MAG: Holliday junction ATP-dependent DNA helicase RuvA [bacterium]|nr:Holliday junction ATP-dependent DNA helicase RuvA [bacterium]MDA1024489.1 Holliday junction ATP-dependent DNA helicase RuvA [bacterium]